jgi:hypothetical protein
MISTRRAALLGLSTPLSLIMVAVLGLWPEEEEETLPEYQTDYYGGGAHKHKRKRIDWEHLLEDDDQPVAEGKNWAIMAMTAVALSEILV